MMSIKWQDDKSQTGIRQNMYAFQNFKQLPPVAIYTQQRDRGPKCIDVHYPAYYYLAHE